MSAGEAWTDLERAREQTIDLIRKSEGLNLSAPIGAHPAFGPLNFYQWVTFLGSHEARHADQIRESPVTAIAPSILRAIGRTPVVRLKSVVPPGAADVIVKLEFYNPPARTKTAWRSR